MAQRTSSDQTESRRFSVGMKEVARVAGIATLLTGILFVYSLLDSGLSGIDVPPLYIIFILVGSVSMLVAWLWEAIGGAIGLLTGVALVLLVAPDHSLTAAMVYGSPFITAGALFLVVWLLRRRAGMPARRV